MNRCNVDFLIQQKPEFKYNFDDLKNIPMKVSCLVDFNVVDGGSLYSGTSDTYIKNDTNQYKISGVNNYGELGVGNTNPVTTFIDIDVEDIKYAHVSSYSFLVAGDNYNLYVSGDNSHGNLGVGDTTNRNSWTLTSLSNVKEVIAGNRNSYIILNDNSLWVAGWNRNGELGFSSGEIRSWSNTEIKAYKVYIGFWNAMVISDGGVVMATGLNQSGILGYNAVPGSGNEYNLNHWWNTGIDGAIDITYGLILKSDGTIREPESLDTATEESTWYDPGLTNVVEITSSKVLLSDGTIRVKGWNGSKYLGVGNIDPVEDWTDPGITNVKKICAEIYNDSLGSVVLLNDNTIRVAGTSVYGKLGIGIDVVTDVWIDPGVNNVKEVFNLAWTVFILKNDGTLWGAGNNSTGVLGLGHENNVGYFTDLGLTNVNKIISLNNYSGYIVVLLDDGTLWGAGYAPGLGGVSHVNTWTKLIIE